MSHLLEVNDLEVKFGLRQGDLTAINGISFNLDKGERMGLVGESGAGKSVTGFAIINLISKPGFISGGRVIFNGRDLAALSEEAMREIRGNHISMIFQDPDDDPEPGADHRHPDGGNPAGPPQDHPEPRRKPSPWKS